VRGGRRRRASALLVIALAVAFVPGCSLYSGNKNERVQEWVNRNAVIADMNTVLSDISSVRRATETGTPKELRTICAGLADDAGTIYETLPSPRLQLTAALDVPVELIFSASNSCSQAVSLTSASTAHALAQLQKAESELKQVQSILATFGVDWRARL
jgi:hypothetical protein